MMMPAKKHFNPIAERMMKLLPDKGYGRRMHGYLSQMYPVPIRLMSAALIYAGFQIMLRRIHDVQVSMFSPFTCRGILSVFLILLILRLMDELKDKDIDRELFTERPLPSGKVLESDIWFSLWVCVVLYLVINAFQGIAFYSAVAVLAYAFLMFRYFFIPDILRRYLLLNLATHNPVIPLILLHVAVVFAQECGLSVKDLDQASLLLLTGMFWSMFLAWELARKIRSQEEENAYVTYSQIFGRRRSVLVAALCQTLTLAIGLYFHVTFSLSLSFLLIMTAGYVTMLGAYARFMMTPTAMTSQLKPWAEAYILSVCLASCTLIHL